MKLAEWPIPQVRELKEEKGPSGAQSLMGSHG
jgi:hypothetical protein